MQVNIHSKKIFNLLIGISLLLSFLSLVIKLVFYFDIIKGDKIVTVNKIFNVDKEHNLPTVYSSYLILFAAFILLIIYFLEKNKPGAAKPTGWLILSLILAYLSIDEIENIHERLGRFLRATFNTTGWIYHVWIIPFGILTLAVFFYFLPFLKRMPSRIRKKFILAGLIYAGSALLGDLFAGRYANTPDNHFGMPYIIMTHTEETGEMLGMCFFIYVLLQYIEENIGSSVEFFLKKK